MVVVRLTGRRSTPSSPSGAEPVAYDIMSLVSDAASDVQICAQCGFSWATLTRAESAARMSSSVESFVDVFQRAGPHVGRRPSEERWSILEYGGHVRDVILSVRERIVLASILDVPVGTPIYRDERIDIGFYAQDAASDVLVELQVGTYLYLKTVATLPAKFEDRTFIYSTRTPLEVTISGAMSNALHECEHHLGDANENLRLLEALE
jgi:hypothetical protein